jgi:RNA polymerase sigma factor (sigma-70 family)
MIDAKESSGQRHRADAGDRADVDLAFAAFYQSHYHDQLRRATVLARTPDAAADAVHEAFVDLYRNWSSVARPEAYLSRAVVNRCRDGGRRASARDRLRLRLIHEPAKVAAGPDPFDDQLWSALAALPYNHRAAVVLRYFGGHTEAEIAELLDCAPGSVGPWIRRGLDRIRRSIEP